MKFILLFTAISLLCACSNSSKTNTNGTPVESINNPATASNPTAQPSEYPIMSFENLEHNFGELMDGQIVENTYKFTNTGKANLLIDRCDVTCGCTTPYFPKTPIAPGESGEIKVKFDSSGKSGVINKNVIVWANVKEQKVEIRFKANVSTQK